MIQKSVDGVCPPQHSDAHCVILEIELLFLIPSSQHCVWLKASYF